MKYLKVLLILILIPPLPTNAQNFSKEFGRVDIAELKLSTYSNDNSAEAVVLFDIGKSYFEREGNNFVVIFERTTRIKIFSNAGLEWAEVEIPFYHEGSIYEEVYDIEARTYNLEGGSINRTALNTNNCHDEKMNEYWNLKKFAMPDVKEGSVIEYKYKIRSQYKFNLRDWKFQSRIPTIYSEYEVKMIPFYEYTYLLQGAGKFDSQTSYVDNAMPRQYGSIEYKDMVNKFIMKNVPDFKDEEFITSINDYIIKIDFQLSKIIHPGGSSEDIITTWPNLIKEFIKHTDFGKYIKKSEKLGLKLFNMESLKNQSSRERFDKIMQYVKDNYNWNRTNSKYCSKSPNDFVKDRIGNSADINLFAVGLLNASGIEAYPVLISTRKNGRIKSDYPYSHFFNYVLIYAVIDDHSILSDATEILISNDRIPSKCINDNGLVINKEKEEWVSLQCYFKSKLQTDFLFDFVNRNLVVNVETSSTEYDAFHYRTTDGENKNRIYERLSNKNYNVLEPTIQINNQSNIHEPYILKYSIVDKIKEINNKIYISPFLNEPMTDNPLNQKTRKYPVDMNYPIERTYASTINIPNGYDVDIVPKDYKINNEFFELVYSVKSYANKIIISFNYSFKKSVYDAKNYTKIKFYFGEIIKKGKEKIVLSRF